ncbi:hypothetical protein B0H10DRAFT_2442540, partial [Mycena sp. CBHHK59/15]
MRSQLHFFRTPAHWCVSRLGYVRYFFTKLTCCIETPSPRMGGPSQMHPQQAAQRPDSSYRVHVHPVPGTGGVALGDSQLSYDASGEDVPIIPPLVQTQGSAEMTSGPRTSLPFVHLMLPCKPSVCTVDRIPKWGSTLSVRVLRRALFTFTLARSCVVFRSLWSWTCSNEQQACSLMIEMSSDSPEHLMQGDRPSAATTPRQSFERAQGGSENIKSYLVQCLDV